MEFMIFLMVVVTMCIVGVLVIILQTLESIERSLHIIVKQGENK